MIPTKEQLEADADYLATVTGWGLAATWRLIRKGQYAAAMERLDRLSEQLLP